MAKRSEVVKLSRFLPSFVIPAKAGTQGIRHLALALLDPRFRGGDGKSAAGVC